VVNLIGQAYRKGLIDFDVILSEKTYSAFKASINAHLAKAIFSNELARRLEGTGVTSNCADPGAVRTQLQKKLPWYIQLLGAPMRIFFASPEKGARTQVYLASSSEVEGVTGKYFKNMKEREFTKEANNENVARRLWNMSEEM